MITEDAIVGQLTESMKKVMQDFDETIETLAKQDISKEHPAQCSLNREKGYFNSRI